MIDASTLNLSGIILYRLLTQAASMYRRPPLSNRIMKGEFLPKHLLSSKSSCRISIPRLNSANANELFEFEIQIVWSVNPRMITTIDSEDFVIRLFIFLGFSYFKNLAFKRGK